MDYLLPSAPEIPMIEYGSHRDALAHEPGRPQGRGGGRRDRLGRPRSCNAVGDALAPLGVTVTSMPLGPNDIFEIIHAES